ncbi:hypothetical protein SAMN05216337_101515 [Bradyrhizobium brasilense]|uniref:Uncharacterized protein n=1 Tax=Bradyrhizobium brasilense TaxID=1419277 RepID=A0A1G6XFL1_9BRAD|nr:hypothetical protein [Bradyrhizobium brasilense]SDD76842.1 hypothetical protein SAMN05216337_101515 [Bradyrhizobium brasilense]
MFEANLAPFALIATTSIDIESCSERSCPTSSEIIEKRMADEQTALDGLVAETFPAAFPFPKDPSAPSSMGALS